MRSKRIKWLDFAKGFTILFVVLGHCAGNAQFSNNFIIKCCAYFSFIFVMPIFFSISGFLYKKVTNSHDYLLLFYKKGISLLIPYFIISFFYLLYNLVIKHQVKLLDFVFGFKFDLSLWFLVSLFLIFILVGTFDLLHINRYVLYGFSLLILFISKNFWVYRSNMNFTHSTLYLIYSYLIFFCLGLFIKQYRNLFHNIFLNKKWMIVFISSFILFCIIQLTLTPGNHQTNYITVTTIVMKILSVFAFSSVFINLNHNTYLFKYFTKYGKYTLIIYLVHFPFEFKLVKLLGSQFYMFVLLFVVTYLFTIFICYLSKYIKFINFIFYPRRYINKWVLKTRWGKRLLD